MSLKSFTHRDDGSGNTPGADSEWTAWVSASKTRNFVNGDPLLDWLSAWGKEKGFTPDTKLPGYDARTDFLEFVFSKGRAFEAAAMEYLCSRFEVTEIAAEPKDARDLQFVERTWEAMNSGIPILSQAVLWNPQSQVYGLPDLLVRSDVLNELFPETLTADEATTPAPDIPGARWHYRVIDIKFTTLNLLKDGHAGSKNKPYAAQVWLYNEALGRIQGFTPPCGYLLGRALRQIRTDGNAQPQIPG